MRYLLTDSHETRGQIPSMLCCMLGAVSLVLVQLLETDSASISMFSVVAGASSHDSAAAMGTPLAPDLHSVLEHVASHVRYHDSRCVDAQRVAVDADM